ncbi:MAG: apocytochrome f, partial [Cyanobacteriota bacterium]
GFEITIDRVNEEAVVEKIPAGPELLVKVGQNVEADQPLTNNPNVGGFGQKETEIVLQNPARIQGVILFFVFIVLAQVFLVLKKKQFEKVQLAEMS